MMKKIPKFPNPARIKGSETTCELGREAFLTLLWEICINGQPLELFRGRTCLLTAVCCNKAGVRCYNEKDMSALFQRSREECPRTPQEACGRQRGPTLPNYGLGAAVI